MKFLYDLIIPPRALRGLGRCKRDFFMGYIPFVRDERMPAGQAVLMPDPLWAQL